MTAFASLQFRKHGISHLYEVAILLAIYNTKGMHIRVLTKIFQLGLLIVRIYRNIYRTNFGTSIKQRQPIRNISRPNADMGSPFHTDRNKSFRHIIHTVIELAPGETEIAVGIYDIFLIRGLFSPVFQPLAQSTIK